MIRALLWEHGRLQLSLLSTSVFALCCKQMGGGGCTDVLRRSTVSTPALGVGEQKHPDTESTAVWVCCV